MRRRGLDVIKLIHQSDALFSIAPQQSAPVIYEAEGAGLRYEALQWGLVPPGRGNARIRSRSINASVEKVASSRLFRAAFKSRRCLVPASGYFEWHGRFRKKKQPYFLRHPNDELLMFAGLWESWGDDVEDRLIRTYAVITGERSLLSANARDRQPVVLPPETWDLWLGGSPDDAQAVLARVPAASFDYHPLQADDPANHSAQFIEP
jgi:putative SOS response-associated peptidase YedK